MTHHTIPLLTASADRQYYGITHLSAYVYQTSKNAGPTRFEVWSNLDRPNPDRGKQLGETLRNGNVLTKFSVPGTAERKFLDPHNVPTDAPVSMLLGPESTAICADTRYNTGQPGSGQVYATGIVLADGDTATLLYPDGVTRDVTIHFPPHRNGHGYATPKES